MNENTYANKLLEILTRDQTLSHYFSSRILEINQRLLRWDDELIRIGLIGVTSSGKSTLLNALLGKAILPTAVRPSSGTIIICSKGLTTHATIIFENGEQENVPEENVVEALEKYGDEIHNVKNKYKVKEIHLQSTKFLLSKNVQIIDSPGLDAYGLERHEELTLSTLLPTIDLCLYVVTFKTNSDDITHRILHQINEQYKPMIIVQNMLDSVVPKIGVNGLVEKSRTEIQKEHFTRTKNILDSINPSLHEIVQIIQLSAKRAMDAQRDKDPQKMEESQLQILIETIKENQKGIKPQLFRTRGASLIQIMDSLLYEESRLMDSKTASETEIQKLEEEIEWQLSDMDKAKEGLDIMEYEFTQTLKKFARKTAKLLKSVKSLDDDDLSGLDKILLNMKRETALIEDAFLDDMKQKHKEVSELMNKYGEDLNEILRTLVTQNSLKSNQDYLGVQYITLKQSHKVKGSGIAEGTKRFFGSIFSQGDWGYVTEYNEKEIIDKKLIEKNIKEYKKEIEGSLQENYTNWASQLQSAISMLQKLLRERKQALNEKRLYGNDLQSLEETLNEVRKLKKELEIKVNNNDKSIQKSRLEIKKSEKIQHSGNTVEIKIDELPYNFYKISKYIVQEIYNKSRIHVDEENKKHQIHNKTIIVGWDEGSLIQFVQRYFSIMITDNDQKELNEKGVLMHGKYCIVYENKVTNEVNNIAEFISAHPTTKTNGYIIADVAQVGQARKQINRSSVINILKKKNVVCNLVMQSFAEFLENREFDEAVEMFDEINEMALFKKGMRLVNDINPVFTLMHLELDNSKSIIYDATKMTDYIRSNMHYLIRSEYIWSAYREYLNALTKRIGAK